MILESLHAPILLEPKSITMKVKLSKSTTNFFWMTIAASAIVFVSMSLIVRMLKHVWE